MAELKKYKNVCRVDAEGYFLGFQRVYQDPRNKGTFLKKPNTIDVESPDIHRVGNGAERAKWNSEKNSWEYIPNTAETQTESNSSKQQTVSGRYFTMNENERMQEANQILTYIRNKRLEETDVFVLRAFEEGKKVSKDMREYREKLRNLPNQIRQGNFNKPILKAEIYEKGDEAILRTKAIDLIEFDHWPTPAKEIKHEL